MDSPPINATVLLVDDQPFMRNAIRGLLHDYNDIQIVGEASDGVEAIQYARMLKPHVVLMDICMPMMDGVQATRAITQEDPEAIVIGLGIAEPGTISQALIGAGAHAYLSKGCLVEDLYPVIARYLDRSALPGQTSKRPPVARPGSRLPCLRWDGVRSGITLWRDRHGKRRPVCRAYKLVASKGTAMNVFTLLQRDHKNVSSLFQQIQGGFGQPDTPERHRLFRDMKRELELHAEVEDLHVYRVFQQAEATRDDAVRALEAHRKIKTLLDELEAAQTYDQTWVSKFQDLQKLVEHHVVAEENEMFRKAMSIMTPQEADELGVKVDAAKHAISSNAPTTEGGTPERS